MASEIGISAGLSVSKGGAVVSGSGTASDDMAGTEMLGAVQNIAATSTQISIGGCDDISYLFVKNMHATTVLQISLDTGFTQIFATLKAGKFGLFPGAPSTLYAKAASGTVDINVVVVES